MDQYIFEIIGAKLSGEELTDNEIQILNDWLDESNYNKRIFQKYKDMFLYHEDIAYFGEINAINAWEKHINKVKSSKSINLRTLLKYAAIILPLVIASTIFFYWYKVDIFQNDNYCSVTVPKGEIQEIKLADGTNIWLNSDSELKYPREFNGNTREVYLKGEAYFSVTKNIHKPFIVNSNLMNIKVLGTEFNLDCYDDSENIEATLYEGKIAFSTKNEEGILEPGFQAILKKDNNKVKIKRIAASQFSLWKEGIYTFYEINIEELAAKISRWYNIKVRITHNSVKTMKFSGAMEMNKPVEFIIDLLEETNAVKCELRNGVLYIGETP